MPSRSSAVKRLYSAAFQARCYSAPVERSIPSAKQKYVPSSGTYPKGFLVGTSHAQVKLSNTRHNDIALVASEQPCTAAAVFTRNLFAAAPVKVSKAILSRRHGDGIRGVIVNSGCANAVTGILGKTNASEMATVTDRCFDPATPELEQQGQWGEGYIPSTIVMSTGVIGQTLPMDRIKAAIPKAHAALASTHEHWMAAAQAICTTDTFPKLVSRTFTLPSHPNTEYKIAGMAKGAGMIHPNMGTLLGIICTDVSIASTDIRRVLKAATDRSFNRISVDGDTSTNDTVALLANGAAAPPDVQPLSWPAKGQPESEDAHAFRHILISVMTELAQLCVRDGEGATKFVTIRVRSTQSVMLARAAASSIATSALVKTALYGKDANWGRILCAIGYAPGIMRNPALGDVSLNDRVDPSKVFVTFVAPAGSGLEDLPVLVEGSPQDVDEAQAKQLLELEDVEILVSLDADAHSSAQESGHEAVYWTCDFSHEYVTINGDYRT